MRFLALFTFLLMGAFSQIAWSSGFGFIPASPDLALGKATTAYEEGKPLPPRYHITVHAGQSFTLNARSVAFVRPRGASEDSPPKPFPAEAAHWLFDDERLQLTAPEKEADPHTAQIRLTARQAGKTRVRFVGLIGGYEKKYDFCLTVLATKAARPTQKND